MLLYVGPSQLIPLSGLLGTVTGLALIFWGKLVQVLHRLVGLFSRAAKQPREKSELKTTVREPS